LGAVLLAMGIAVYVRLFGDGSPWIVLAVMAPGVAAYQVGMRMMIREAKRQQK
jgi:hypothetical protein